MRCPICESRNIKKEYVLYDDRYGYPDSFNIWKCTDCDFYFLENNLGKKDIENLYTNYYPRKDFDFRFLQPAKKYIPILGWFFRSKSRAYIWIPKNKRILDIGCGTGETLLYHKKRGCEVYGIDPDSNLKILSEMYNLNIHTGIFDSSIYQKNFFDYITMDQVIEHVNDPVHFLSEVKKILKQDGKIIISTPNSFGFGAFLFGKKWLNWHVPYHVNFFSKKSLIILLSKSGFKLEKIKTITPPEWIFYQICHLLFFPKKGKISYFWRVKKSFFTKLIIFPFLVLYKFGFFSILSIIIDLFGTGDNYIVIASNE